jgi:hypothetical protein
MTRQTKEHDPANECLEFSLKGKLKFTATWNILNKIIIVTNDLYEDHQMFLILIADSGHKTIIQLLMICMTPFKLCW